jgi:hypothetical protein
MIIPQEAGGKKGKRGKGEGVGIGKEFDNLAGIVLAWVQSGGVGFKVPKQSLGGKWRSQAGAWERGFKFNLGTRS